MNNSFLKQYVNLLAAAKTPIDAAISDGKAISLVNREESGKTSYEAIGMAQSGIGGGLITSLGQNQVRSNLITRLVAAFDENNGNGTLTATVGNKSHNVLKTMQVIYSRDTDGAWKCEIDTKSKKGWKAKFTPNGCTTK